MENRDGWECKKCKYDFRDIACSTCPHFKQVSKDNGMNKLQGSYNNFGAIRQSTIMQANVQHVGVDTSCDSFSHVNNFGGGQSNTDRHTSHDCGSDVECDKEGCV